MAKYLEHVDIEKISECRKLIMSLRKPIFLELGIDILDTDALSATAIYEIVRVYDNNYNINFSRNGEDAKSLDIKIEQKATRVLGPKTKTNKDRTGYGKDASFTFHAHGDIEHDRFVFATLIKETLDVDRLYDIGKPHNVQKVVNYLLEERRKYDERCALDPRHKKRDTIVLPEVILQKFELTKSTINGCKVYRD